MAESRPTPGALSDIGDALIPQQWPVALHCPRKPFSKRELVDKRQVSHGSKPTLFCQRLVLCRRKSIVLSPLGSLGDRNDASHPCSRAGNDRVPCGVPLALEKFEHGHRRQRYSFIWQVFYVKIRFETGRIRHSIPLGRRSCIKRYYRYLLWSS